MMAPGAGYHGLNSETNDEVSGGSRAGRPAGGAEPGARHHPSLDYQLPDYRFPSFVSKDICWLFLHMGCNRQKDKLQLSPCFGCYKIDTFEIQISSFIDCICWQGHLVGDWL